MCTERSASPLGAYGFRLTGVDGAPELLLRAPADWPELEVVRGDGATGGPPGDRVWRDRIELSLQTGGWVAIERHPTRATFEVERELDDAALVHPYLAPVAALAARWLGRESFHAGAVVAGGGAWAVLGDKRAGKSSTLAELALRGYAVMTDDILVVDGGDALAGPRCIDLRAEPAKALGVGVPLGVVGARERWRLGLETVEPRIPLRGWIRLAWGSRVEAVPVRGAERLVALTVNRAVYLAPETPGDIVHLSSLPQWELRRPQRWESLPAAVDRLSELIGA